MESIADGSTSPLSVSKMKVACLQLDSKMYQVDQNMRNADALLHDCRSDDFDLLVLPEMAFTGYNFPSLESILPYLERTTSGRTTQWAQTTARRLRCFVTVGYPEETDTGTRYNSTVTVDRQGRVVANYRKTFLFYTDLSWATAGEGFFAGRLDDLGDVCMGICMDLNCHVDSIDGMEDHAFAAHCIETKATTIALSNAWLWEPDKPLQELIDHAEEPDFDLLKYWSARLKPLIDATGNSDGTREVVMVICNRIGMDPASSDDYCARTAADGSWVIPYGGCSCVIKAVGGRVVALNTLGRATESLLVVDTGAMEAQNRMGDVATVLAESHDSVA